MDRSRWQQWYNVVLYDWIFWSDSPLDKFPFTISKLFWIVLSFQVVTDYFYFLWGIILDFLTTFFRACNLLSLRSVDSPFFPLTRPALHRENSNVQTCKIFLLVPNGIIMQNHGVSLRVSLQNFLDRNYIRRSYNCTGVDKILQIVNQTCPGCRAPRQL